MKNFLLSIYFKPDKTDFEILFHSFCQKEASATILNNCELMYTCKACRNIFLKLDKYILHFERSDKCQTTAANSNINSNDNLKTTTADFYSNTENISQSEYTEFPSDIDENQIFDIEDLMCLICNKKFHTEFYLQMHVAFVHSSFKHFKCKFCEFKAHSTMDCRNHLMEFHSDRMPSTETKCSKDKNIESSGKKRKRKADINLENKVPRIEEIVIDDEIDLPFDTALAGKDIGKEALTLNEAAAQDFSHENEEIVNLDSLISEALVSEMVNEEVKSALENAIENNDCKNNKTESQQTSKDNLRIAQFQKAQDTGKPIDPTGKKNGKKKKGYHSVTLNKLEMEKLDVENLICRPCGKKFPFFFQLKLHFAIEHLRLKLFKCHLCGSQTNSEAECRKHFLFVHPKWFRKHTISNSGYKFLNLFFKLTVKTAEKKRPELTARKKKKKKLFCRICNRSFKRRNRLEKHALLCKSKY